MNKQETGFKFGIHETKVIRFCGQICHDGRIYKLELLEADGKPYYSIRLYNSQGKFIKQFMFEPVLLSRMINLFMSEEAHLIGEAS